jgi:class 3 adenylate cyclase
MLPPVRYARVGEMSIAFQVWGEGPIDLVLASGPAGNVEIQWEFRPMARILARLGTFARVAAFDRRGTGLSDAATGPPTLEQHMEDLAAVVDAAGFSRPAILGFSEAGRMALLYAASYPEQVRSLVLGGTTAYGAAVMAPAVVERISALIEQEWGTGRLMDVFAPSLAGDAELRRAFGRYERLSVSPGAARQLMELSVRMDVRGILGSVRVPTLVLHRRDDELAPIEAARELAAAIPEARLVELPGRDNALWAGDATAMLDVTEEFLTGQPPHHEPDRVLATVLFTDICNSTGHAAWLGDRAWRELLGRHHRVVRRELERHRGHEVKTVGDGFVATFDGPARAVHAAARAEAALREELGLRLRAGVHTGEIEVLDDDIAGVAVHIAARVCDLAAPGEVLVSRTVRDLVVGSGLEFAERGIHRLRGVPDEWDLLALVPAAVPAGAG